MERFTVVHYNELTGYWHVEETQGSRRWETPALEVAEEKAAAFRRFDFPAHVLPVKALQQERVGKHNALVVQEEQASTLSRDLPGAEEPEPLTEAN